LRQLLWYKRRESERAGSRAAAPSLSHASSSERDGENAEKYQLAYFGPKRRENRSKSSSLALLPTYLVRIQNSCSNQSMNMVDAAVLALLAIGDIALIANLRRRRGRALQADRMMRSLVLAVRRDNEELDLSQRSSLVDVG
jgi:hypothetical protein